MKEEPLQFADEDRDTAQFEYLLKKSREGDTGCLEALLMGLRRYLRFISRRALTPFLKSKVSIADVLQDLLMRAWEKFKQFRGMTQGELCQWLKTILKNVIRDYARYWKAGKRKFTHVVTLYGEEGVEVAGMPTEPSACTEAILRERNRYLELALEALPERHGQVLRLMCEGVVSVEEKAARLSVAPADVPALEREAVEALKAHVLGWNFRNRQNSA